MVFIHEKSSNEGIYHGSITSGVLPDVNVGSWDDIWKAFAREYSEADKGVLVRMKILLWICGIILFFGAAIDSFSYEIAREDERSKAMFKILTSLPAKDLKDITINGEL